MGAAKKLDQRLREEVLMGQYRKEGRVTSMMVGVREIDPKKGFQAREIPLDLDHVRRLQGMMIDGAELFRVVVFRDPKTKTLHLADGFHRLDAYRREGRKNIPADVINGTADDALEYATCCNELAIKTRTKADTTRAIMLLLANPRWFSKADATIASHVSINRERVASCRLQYCDANAVPLPDRVENSKGFLTPYRSPKANAGLLIRSPRPENKSGEDFWLRRNGTRTYLGDNKEAAEARAAKILENQASIDRMLSRNGGLSNWLMRRAIPSKQVMVGSSPFRHDCLLVRGYILISIHAFESEVCDHALASVAVFRAIYNDRYTPVVVWPGNPFRSETIDALKASGILFLTPDELVDRIKATEKGGE